MLFFHFDSNRTVKDRVQILMKFHQLVVQHADELADLIVLEHGKVRTVWHHYLMLHHA